MAIGRRAHLGMALVCGSCRQRFHSALELQRHRASALCKDEERYGCPHCSKDFGNRQILRLHMRVHEESTAPPVPPPKTDTAQEASSSATSTTGLRPFHSRLPFGNAAKKIGFTKIRLEDCLRCDECSCVYMYESDYLKHMRNFHRIDSPRKNKQKKGCRSCCRHCNCRDGAAPPQPSVETERGNNNLFHFNIKDRWSKVVSRHLADAPGLKEEDDEEMLPASIDLSHLLSQVEVKIKTEPPEFCEDDIYSDKSDDFLPICLADIKTEPAN